MVNIDERKILEAFMEEVRELLDGLNQKLLELEQSPEDSNIINEIFRLTHSVKSESALVGFKNISTIAHKMEDIFERVRRGVLLVDTPIMDRLFAAYDRIMLLLNGVANGISESGVDISDVVNPLLAILNEQPVASPAAEAKPQPAPPTKTAVSQAAEETPKAAQEPAEEESFGTVLVVNTGTIETPGNVEFTEIQKSQIEEAIEKGEKFYKIVFHIEDECDMKYPRAYLVFNNFENCGNVIKTLPDVQSETNDEKFSEVTLFFLSDAPIGKFQECADVDQVDKLSILEISSHGITEKLNAVVAGAEAFVSPEEIEKAEDLEKKWAEEMMKSNAAQEPSTPVTTAIKKDMQHVAEKITQKQTIRVDIERLDELLNLVGELIINRSRFIQITDTINEGSVIQDLKTDLEDATNELERISDQMQMKMMQARMVPVGNVFSKFPRMVRDLSNTLHKNVHLDIIGENTEIDRTVIENLAEPLTHLIRNSVDHGIEAPEEREKKGKNREGKVTLKAYQEGSNIFIEVSDDGKGIDVEAVKAKAVENGLATSAQVASMPLHDIFNFIFEPGFSTKKEISNVSGRGVGMDVVKTQLEKLRGRIDITTKQGGGTCFTIILPLTTTIVEALLVNVDKNIFAIPISVVEETLKVGKNEIKQFDDYRVYNLRNETLAIIELSDLVCIEKNEQRPSDEVFIVVISFERRRIGLVVNDLMGEQDIVIKGLDDVLKNSEGIAGAAVLGDGRIALILDTSTLVKATLKEINKLAKNVDIHGENEGAALTSLYDSLNKDRNKLTGSAVPQPQVMGENSKPEIKKVNDKSKSPDEDNLKKINEIMREIRDE